MQANQRTVDYNIVLLELIKINTPEDGDIVDFDDRLQHILKKVQPILGDADEMYLTKSIDHESRCLAVRSQYIHTVVHVLNQIKQSNLSDDKLVLSVKQCQALKVSFELLFEIGIIPGLLPGVGIDMAKLCHKDLRTCKVKLTDIEVYQRLRFTINSVMQLYNETIFRPAILAHIGLLLAAVLQSSYAPLMKPLVDNIEGKDASTDSFKMTTNLYEELKEDQEQFKVILDQLLTSCPVPTVMKELMIILGVKGAPKWLQRVTRKYLVKQLVQSNGVVSMIAAVCNDTLDLGAHWNKLDTISKLIATSHGNNSDEYYKSICPQLLDLLASAQIKYAAAIANCCITALYKYNPDVCLTNIVDVICAPLLITSEETLQRSRLHESDVETCIENLTKCFVTTEAKFKQLPCKLLLRVAVPLFSLHNSIRQSPCALKRKVKSLLSLLVLEESSDNLYAAFLGHKLSNELGYQLTSTFGPTGGIEITGIDSTPVYEEYADSLFDLMPSTGPQPTALFSYLLKFLSSITQLNDDKVAESLLETQGDTVNRIEKQLAAVKLLSTLANTPAVQEGQMANPAAILSFIKSLLDQYTRNKEASTEEDNCELLYISLMLIKMILTERKNPPDWSAFRDFATFLKERCTMSKVPPQLFSLSKELIEVIDTRGRSEQRNYLDLSVDRKPSNKFEEAVKDLADPLLPVRAHGLIALTKLIESGDAYANSSKALLLELFKTNLKHEDSFIYLAAINGLCALTSSHPQVVLEILIQEYIGMPQCATSEESTIEIRIKLGEVLVKVTRSLGDMVMPHKSTLINGFLCATRDPVDSVRASSLSCLGELCKVLGFRLGNTLTEVLYCISCIMKTDKSLDCRRAAVMVTTLLIHGLGKDVLSHMSQELLNLYRAVKYLHDNDVDPGIRLHASLTLEQIDSIVRDNLLSPPKLEKRIFLLDAV